MGTMSKPNLRRLSIAAGKRDSMVFPTHVLVVISLQVSSHLCIRISKERYEVSIMKIIRTFSVSITSEDSTLSIKQFSHPLSAGSLIPAPEDRYCRSIHRWGVRTKNVPWSDDSPRSSPHKLLSGRKEKIKGSARLRVLPFVRSSRSSGLSRRTRLWLVRDRHRRFDIEKKIEWIKLELPRG